MKGNKGEWSELYALLRLLAYGKLFAANEKVQKINDTYFPILQIFREDVPGKAIRYVLEDNKQVDIYINEKKVKDIQTDRIRKYADFLYKGILDGTNRAFEISGSENIMSELECERLAAPSSNKTDII